MQLLNENASIKRNIAKFEHERAEIQMNERNVYNSAFSDASDGIQIKQMNTRLQKRIEFLQKREKDLLEHLLKAQKDKRE